MHEIWPDSHASTAVYTAEDTFYLTHTLYIFFYFAFYYHMSIKKSGTFTVGATGANVGPAAFFTFLNVGGPTPSKFNFPSFWPRGPSDTPLNRQIGYRPKPAPSARTTHIKFWS